jgi:hypothetical protein
VAGVSDTNDRLTFAVVAFTFPKKSFVSTLASAVPATFDEAFA